MAIPDYQTLMRPALAIHADGREHRSDEIRAAIVREFEITDEDRRQLLPSGRTPLLNNRVHWAVTYLAQAGALERTRRSYTRITDRGRDLLERHGARIEAQDLTQFPEFADFVSRNAGRSRGETSTAPTEPVRAAPVRPTEPAPSGPETVLATATPNEVIDAAYRELRSVLADELVDRVKSQTPQFFEDLVLDVLIAMGYGGTRTDAAERLGRSGDGRIDGVIREDALGLDQIYVQAKRWEGAVGRPVIQGFVGALHGAHADRGVLITTSHFTPDAISYAQAVPARVILIDGRQLAELMIDYGVGVTTTTRYELSRIDADYFPEEVATDTPAPDEG